VSWLERLRQLFATTCPRCGASTVIEREELLASIPAVFEVVAWCPRCAEVASRRQVVDCAL
jgi:ribosomal protein S27AE